MLIATYRVHYITVIKCSSYFTERERESNTSTMNDRTMQHWAIVWMFLSLGYYSQPMQADSILYCLQVRVCLDGTYDSDMANNSLILEDVTFKSNPACQEYKSCQNAGSFLGGNDLPSTPSKFASESEFAPGEAEPISTNMTELCTLVINCVVFQETHSVGIVAPPLEEYSADYILGRYCPASDFCGHDSARLPRQAKSCCSSCKCNPDCDSYITCCNKSRNSFANTQTQNSKCIEVPLVNILASLNMVFRCPNGSDCRDLDIAYPVLSKATKRIYINSACAECNAVSGYDIWRFRVRCNKFAFAIGDIVTAFDDPSRCDFDLVPPLTQTGDLMKYVCPMVQDCPESVVNQTLIELCRSINSPILAMRSEDDYLTTYANAYCAHCNSATPNYILCNLNGIYAVKFDAVVLTMDVSVMSLYTASVEKESNLPTEHSEQARAPRLYNIIFNIRFAIFRYK